MTPAANMSGNSGEAAMVCSRHRSAGNPDAFGVGDAVGDQVIHAVFDVFDAFDPQRAVVEVHEFFAEADEPRTLGAKTPMPWKAAPDIAAETGRSCPSGPP